MSILIKGMEMPKSCDECRFFDWHKGMGNFCNIDESIKYKAHFGKDFEVTMERIGDCPLIEVPKHGRLIDVEELRHWILTEMASLDSEEDREFVADRLANELPTIIEAEEE